MTSKLNQILFIVCLGISSHIFADETLKVIWPKDKSAVAWLTKKRMFLVNTVEPIGFNTAILVSKDDTKKRFVIRIPINKFDSGEPDRDAEVVKILKGDLQPDLLFTSDPVTEELEKNIQQDQFSGALSGELKIGGKSFEVTFNVKKIKDGQREFLDGSLPTTYTAFEIEPPTVAGGLVAKVRDELTLLFHIELSEFKK